MKSIQARIDFIILPWIDFMVLTRTNFMVLSGVDLMVLSRVNFMVLARIVFMVLSTVHRLQILLSVRKGCRWNVLITIILTVILRCFSGGSGGVIFHLLPYWGCCLSLSMSR